MDPNATLAALRNNFADLNAAESDEERLALIERIDELWEALDAWMSRGGFTPKTWQTTS